MLHQYTLAASSRRILPNHGSSEDKIQTRWPWQDWQFWDRRTLALPELVWNLFTIIGPIDSHPLCIYSPFQICNFKTVSSLSCLLIEIVSNVLAVILDLNLSWWSDQMEAARSGTSSNEASQQVGLLLPSPIIFSFFPLHRLVLSTSDWHYPTCSMRWHSPWTKSSFSSIPIF